MRERERERGMAREREDVCKRVEFRALFAELFDNGHRRGVGADILFVCDQIILHLKGREGREVGMEKAEFNGRGMKEREGGVKGKPPKRRRRLRAMPPIHRRRLSCDFQGILRISDCMTE